METFLLFEIGSQVAKAGLELLMLLPLPPELGVVTVYSYNTSAGRWRQEDQKIRLRMWWVHRHATMASWSSTVRPEHLFLDCQPTPSLPGADADLTEIFRVGTGVLARLS